MTNWSDCCGKLTYTQPTQRIDEETGIFLEWIYIRKCSKCHEPCQIKKEPK